MGKARKVWVAVFVGIIVTSVIVLFGATMAVSMNDRDKQEISDVNKILEDFSTRLNDVIKDPYLDDAEKTEIIAMFPYFDETEANSFLATNKDRKTGFKLQFSDVVIGMVTADVRNDGVDYGDKEAIDNARAKLIAKHFQEQYDAIYNTKITDHFSDEDWQKVKDIERDINNSGVIDAHTGEDPAYGQSGLLQPDVYARLENTLHAYVIIVNNANNE